MPAFIVAYDLMKQGQNYDCIVSRIERYPNHWHMQQSVWIVAADTTAVRVRDDLSQCLDQNDKIFVARLSGEAAWLGYNNKVTDWLKKYL